MTTKKVAVYMRVSTENQEKEETIKNQHMELMEHIGKDENAYLAPECIYKDEGWSGAILERPALDKMRADAADGKFNVLYIYDRGRLARKFVYQEIVIEELRKYNVEVMSLHDINGETTEERLMGGVMGLFHEYERVKITERMRIGKIRRVKESKKLLGYQPRYGYDYHPRIKKGVDARDGYFSINDKQAEVVKKIFNWSANGMSKYGIKMQLHKLGIAPLKQKSGYWSTSVIDRILRDSTYFGEHYYNKTESVETRNPRKVEKYRKHLKGSRIARPKSDWLKVVVPAIIDKELFDRAQVQLARNKKFAPRNNKKNHYLLRGLVYCTCGMARTGDPANNSRYYRCTRRQTHQHIGNDEPCKHGINVPVMDKLVWDSIEGLLLQPDLLMDQAKRWQAKASPVDEQIDLVKAQIKVIDEKHGRYIKLYGDGDMSEKDYKDEKYQLDEKRSALLHELAALEDEKANHVSLPLDKLLSGVVKLVEELDETSKDNIIQKIVTKIIATKEEVTVWGKIPVLSDGKIGLNVKHRHCWLTERWQVYAIQCTYQQRHFGRQLSVCNYRAKYRRGTCSGRSPRRIGKNVQFRKDYSGKRYLC